MKYARFQKTNLTIGISPVTGESEEGRLLEMIGGHEFVDGICTVTDQHFELAPANACIVLKHHRAKLVEKNF